MVTDRWNDTALTASASLLEQRVYTSRLLGTDPNLVMHGGGNTSVKALVKNIFGEEESVIFIKGSGWDLATIEAQGFPAVRLNHLQKLRELPSLEDGPMVNEFRTHLMDSRSPDPSVETLLHAYLPHAFVDHTHADAVLAITNQPNGEALIRELYGKSVGVVPYVMPGFALSKLCAEVYEKDPSVEGLILLKHGVLTFGATAKESYQRMIGLVQQAENFLKETESKKKRVSSITTSADADTKAQWMLHIRKQMLQRGFPCTLQLDDSPASLQFVNHPDAGALSNRGPLTPDHVIRTKQFPAFVPNSVVTGKSFAELEKVVGTYTAKYDEYFSRQVREKKLERTKLDSLPRVWLLPTVGIITTGNTTKEASIAMDIYRHTAEVILTAEQIGRYEALGDSDIFDMEYWVLEQAKLALGPKKKILTGKVALVTGGASGIGLGITKTLAENGADVFAIDYDDGAFQKLTTEFRSLTKSGNRVTFLKADVTDRKQMSDAFRSAVLGSGGFDFAVINAGIFPPSALLEDISEESWKKSLDVNLTGSFHSVSESLRWLKAQAAGGDIVFIASKNAAAPGPEAGAYSVAKAGQVQLARVTALEAGKHGIRVNVLHPHLVFDTGIWTEEVIAKRAAAYRMTPDEYRCNNLLKTALSTKDVASATLALVSGSFSKTTGAQIPVDGGSDRTL